MFSEIGETLNINNPIEETESQTSTSYNPGAAL